MMAPSPPHDAHIRRRAAELAAHAESLSRRILEVTAPLYILNADREPEAIGSSVLIMIGEVRLLLTAAHVLDWRKQKPMFAGVSGGLIPVVDGAIRIFAETAKTVDDDHVDIGVVRLGGDNWQTVPQSAFTTWDELDHAPPIADRHTFALIGYPLTKQRDAIKGTILEARAYPLAALETQPSVYGALGRDPTVSLVLGFDKRQVWSPQGLVTAPDMHGVSGGGVWRFGRRLRNASEAPKLSGIAIEWEKRGRYKHVLATRIRPILAGMARTHPDIGEHIRAAIAE